MANKPNPAAEAVAASYEAQLKNHQQSAQAVITKLTELLQDPMLEASTRQGAEEALAYAHAALGMDISAAKSGKVTVKEAPPKPVSDAAAANKTISQEGQPTGQGSVFGAWYNQGSQSLSQAGQIALAQALGSKYLIGINEKANVSEDTKGLGALASIIKPGLTAAQILTTLMVNQDQGTITAIQRELVGAGYLDPLHTTNLQIGQVGAVNDPTLQALANLLEASSNHSTPVQKILATGQKSSQGQDFLKLWDSTTGGQPFSVTGQQTNVSSPESLAGTLREAASSGTGGKGVLSGGAGKNPDQNQTAEFISQAQQFQMEHPAQVTTQYVPQPGLGISGFTRFPLQKSQTTMGGADQAAMDQFTYNWLVQNMGPDVAAQGAANILSAFNQLLGLNAAGVSNTGASSAGGAA